MVAVMVRREVAEQHISHRHSSAQASYPLILPLQIKQMCSSLLVAPAMQTWGQEGMEEEEITTDRMDKKALLPPVMAQAGRKPKEV